MLSYKYAAFSEDLFVRTSLDAYFWLLFVIYFDSDYVDEKTQYFSLAGLVLQEYDI